jgi:hypothetical protein
MTFTLRRACAAGAVAIVLTAGCATPAPPAQMTSPFNASDVAWSRGPGTATVEGRAAIPAGGSASHTCASGEAQLLPAGTYAAEMMRIVFGSDVRGYAPLASSPRYPANIAADFKSTVRRIGCDAEGRFRFDAVPAGRWYVFSNVVWRTAGGEAAPQGGALMQRIDVAEGARANVVLTP